jgi:ribosome-binding factor A
MTSRRTLRIAEQLRKILSMAIMRDVNDPRIKGMVTVTKVEVAADLRNAKVFITIMGDEKTEALTLKGLNASRGFLQSRIADGVDLRYTPRITFEIDEGVKKSHEVLKILDDIRAEDHPAVDDETDIEDEDDLDEDLDDDEGDEDLDDEDEQDDEDAEERDS